MIPRIPTVVSIDNEDQITKSLYSEIYHNVHSRPYSEYRHNIVLKPLLTESRANIVNILSTSIRLPASGRWFLYTVDNTELVSIRLPSDKTWTCLSDYQNAKTSEWITGYCTETGVDIRFILTNYSKCIPRFCIWVLKHPKANQFIFAIKESVINELADSTTTKTKDVSLNVYYHKKEIEFKVVGYYCNKLTIRNEFFKICNNESIPKIIFINGIECIPKNLEDVFEGSYGEIIYDSSIVGSFTVDFDIHGENIYSGSDSIFKLLCHIPKALNPDNLILNSRVCDIFIHPDKDQIRNYTDGYYVNRLNTEKQIFTITHNDFSLHRGLVLNYLPFVNSERTCQIKIYVRDNLKGFKVNRDPNYLRELYQLDDDTIVNHLLGKDVIKYWKASYLEKSKWTYMVDNYLCGITEATLPECIEGLGYLNSGNAIDQRVIHLLISNELQKRFYIPIPLCYSRVDNLMCHIFIDGRLQDNDHFRYYKEKQFLVIDVDQYISLEVGSRITIELFEGVDYKARYISLSSGESITFATEVNHQYLIYKEVPFSDYNKVDEHYIYKRFDLETSYRPFLDMEYDEYVTEEDAENGYTYVTINNTSSREMDLLVTSKYAYAKIYGVERHLKELNYDIWCSHLLKIKAKVFPLVDIYGNIVTDDSTISIPYLNTDRTMLVYLNGKELIKDLDYKDYQIKTDKKYICGQFVVLQNVDYLRVVSNVFEVFTVNEKLVSLDSGFLTSKTTETIKSRLSYFDKISAVFIDGDMAQYYNDDNYFVQLLSDVRQGASYKIRTLLPRCLTDFFDTVTSLDTTEVDTILDYMSDKLSSTLTVTPITRSYHIYSTFLQTITEQILRKKLKYDLYWTDDQIKYSLSKYLDMLNFDISMSENNIEITDKEEFVKPPKQGLDFRFVDILPSYRLERLEDSDLTIQEERPMLIISGSNQEAINGNYLCMNPGIEYMRYQDQITDHHINENAEKRYESNTGSYIEHRDNYWHIYMKDGSECYRAQDTRGIVDIWNLNWEPVGTFTAIIIKVMYVQVATSNEFPIHRLQFTRSSAEYAYLMRVAKLYLKTDLAKDGMNI